MHFLLRRVESPIIYNNIENSILQVQEAEKAVDIPTYKLQDNNVFTIWKWNRYDPPDTCSVPSEADETELNSDSCEEVEDDGKGDSTDLAHSVIFKCIGVTRDPKIQETLKLVARKIKDENEVEVQLAPEPTNPVDSNAIAFLCKLNDRWQRIGYVVREALDAVHDAIERKKIVTVKFEWVKYIIHFSRSGPGWYAGIKITKSGQWPTSVVRCSSR